ncbi:hypothetical protein CBR_g3522 [Chara braunii]|uniref:Protein YIP n=1 Tax=Chara braunii TaxID=69332 RepID=A0A388KFK1_CHABU|nr:hypothetical protein CBR_g3522 [Chara braunii]|eukprot:GBG68828.1 hypothetical protein CBR_g3522 [Chara braunii]
MSMSDNLGVYGSLSGTVPVAAGPEVVLPFQDPYAGGIGVGHPLGASPLPAANANASVGPSGAGDGGEASSSSSGSGWRSIFNISTYKPYFDVDTVDVLERIQETLIPNRSTFLEKTGARPDIYGPFWICTTLIFLASALGNIANYLSSSKHTDWHLDINKVSRSTTLLYGYVGLVPLLLFGVLKYYGMTSGLVQLWCMYGYSLFIYIPCMFVTVIPFEFLRWLAVAASCFLSTWFLATNIRAHVEPTSERWFTVVVSAMGLHVLLAIVIKISFFSGWGKSGKD